MKNLSYDMIDKGFYATLLSLLYSAMLWEMWNLRVFQEIMADSKCMHLLYTGFLQPSRLGAICSINYTSTISPSTP